MNTVTILSRCGRYRITATPCDDGTVVEVWQQGSWFDRHAGQPRRVMWRRESREIVDLPFHVALDRAHDALGEIRALQNGSVSL